MPAENTSLPTVIFLMGPTASGKTDLALALCDRLACEIISVDSAMVYRGMDIGTGKPSERVLEKYPHHLIDILDPSERYSAAQFREDATRVIDQIISRQKIPLLVGGTHLYFRALERGLSPLPSADAEIRRELKQQATIKGWPALHQELQSRDPGTAERIHPNDAQRIQRALEIIALTGRTPSQCHAENRQMVARWKIRKYALDGDPRALLHQHIEIRFQSMMKQGLIEEVSRLYKRGNLDISMPSVRSVGYRQLWQHLEGTLTLDQAINRAIIATRQLAKRQMTWLRKEQDITWLKMGAGDNLHRMLDTNGVDPA